MIPKSFVDVDSEPLHHEEFQNDYIRIYRALLEPGKSTKFHRHSRDTLYLVFKGGEISTEKMKGTPSCPTILARGLPVSGKLRLAYEKIFFRYLSLETGFFFYMPSKRSPVIHRAITSKSNHESMDLLGVEILFSNKDRIAVSNCSGREEIDTKEIRVSRLSSKAGQILTDICMEEPALLIVITGEITIIDGQKSVFLKAGIYYWAEAKSNHTIANKSVQDSEIVIVKMKSHSLF